MGNGGRGSGAMIVCFVVLRYRLRGGEYYLKYGDQLLDSELERSSIPEARGVDLEYTKDHRVLTRYSLPSSR